MKLVCKENKFLNYFCLKLNLKDAKARYKCALKPNLAKIKVVTL